MGVSYGYVGPWRHGIGGRDPAWEGGRSVDAHRTNARPAHSKGLDHIQTSMSSGRVKAMAGGPTSSSAPDCPRVVDSSMLVATSKFIAKLAPGVLCELREGEAKERGRRATAVEPGVGGRGGGGGGGGLLRKSLDTYGRCIACVRYGLQQRGKRRRREEEEEEEEAPENI